MPCDNPYNHFCEALKPVHEIGGTPEFLDRALVSPTVSAHPEIGDPSFWEFINA
jgi:hypothetical protein